MTIIKKGSVAEKIFKELLSASKTQKTSTVIESIRFLKDKGYYLVFSENIRSIFIKDKSVTDSFAISDSFIVPAICIGFDNGDSVIEFDKTNSKAIVNGIEFTDIDTDFDEEKYNEEITDYHLTFTKEQLENFENDFNISLGNYFKNPETVDTITFGINEGRIYKYATSTSCWKLSKLTDSEATINTVKIEQDYGHTIKAWTLPHKIFNFMKMSDCVNINFDENYIEINSKEFKISFRSRETKTKTLKEYLKYFNNDEIEKFIDFQLPDGAKRFIKDISHNFYEQEEDFCLNIKFKKQKGIELAIDDKKLFINDESVSNDFSIEANTFAINYILNDTNEKLRINKENGLIIFYNGNSFYIVPNSEDEEER